MIPQEYIQEVVRRNDIEDIVGQYVQLRRRGRTLTGLCPFHNEKTPSFVVYPDTQSFYCFGCGAAGDVISFVRKYNNLGYVETVKQLASRAGMPLPEEDDKESRARQRLLEINRCAARYFYEQLNARTPEAALARRYWREKRGLSDAAIRRFGLGYAPEDFTGLLHYLRRLGFSEEELEYSGLVKRSAKGNLYDIFRHRVMVPIIDVRGAIIAFGGRVLDDSKPKYINSPETMVYKKSRTLFALNVAKKSPNKRYILCEGYMDVISMHEAGFDTAVCACGTALTPEQVKLLTEYADEVVLSYDSDEAGQKATARSLAMFTDADIKVRVLSYQGAKDPDEFIKKYGRERFAMLLDGSADPTEFQLKKAAANYDLRDSAGRLNYLKDASELTDFFRAAFLSVREGGALFVDLSTPYKLEHVLGNHFIGDETPEIAYLWQNRYNRAQGYVDLNLAIFVRQKDETYLRIGEQQRQYAHSAQLLTELMEAVGFTDIRLYGDKKLSPPDPHAVRWFLAARKPLTEEAPPTVGERMTEVPEA